MRELPQESVLILKNHPFVRDCCEIPEEYQDRVLDLSREENINDLLFITSVLITDYSSVIFEAVLLNIPILFYTFDLQEYLEKRDLYFEFAAFAPGKIISDMEALIKAAAGLLDDPTEETSPAMTKTQFQMHLMVTRHRELCSWWRNCWQPEIDRKERIIILCYISILMKKNGGCICQSTRIGTKNLIVWKQGKASIPGMSLKSLSRTGWRMTKLMSRNLRP